MSKRKSIPTPDELAAKKTKFPVTLAKNYDPEKHCVHDGNWAWSLKLDGVRAYWDVEKKQLLSRNNKPFTVPKYLLASLTVGGTVATKSRPKKMAHNDSA